MANLRDIRDRITSVKNTQQITRAMKMVAAARLRKAQDRAIASRPYGIKLKEVMTRLVGTAGAENPLLEKRDTIDKVLMIVIGSDRGLCGGFNTNLFRVVDQQLGSDFSQYVKSKNLDIITIGKKAGDHYSKRQNVISRYDGFFDHLNFDKAAKLMSQVIQMYEKGTYDMVYLAFNEFKSVIAQNRLVEQLLPVSATVSNTEISDSGSNGASDYIFEPGAAEILDALVPRHLNMQLWRALLESFASEQGARMAAMDNATENAKEIIRELQLKYNQARQAAITTEISEIVSGAEALSQ